MAKNKKAALNLARKAAHRAAIAARLQEKQRKSAARRAKKRAAKQANTSTVATIDYHAMTYRDLQQECKVFGFSARGTKLELVNRLQEI